jgi:hypothetical protein
MTRKNKKADNWFDSVNFTSIVDTVKGIMTSDGSISVLLDFERVIDEADVYAYKNWLLGELVQGPNIGRYSVTCTFMWPYKLMPDPTAVKRLLAVGCDVGWEKSKIKVPVEVENYEDFIQGTMYPKSVDREVWLVKITIPMELMDDIKEGSIDIAGSSIDLKDLDAAYDEDLNKQGLDKGQALPATGGMGGLGAGPPLPGTLPGLPGL